MPKLRPDVRDERRRHLLDAAWRCAAAKRFAEMTVDDVCAEAGLSKGAFYGYFESKDELLAALLDDDAAALDRMLDRIGEEETSGIERLRRFSRAMVEHADDPGSRPGERRPLGRRARAGAAAPPVRRDQRSATGAHPRLDRGGRRARTRLREVPANALASMLLAIADGLMLHATLDPSAFRWANIRRAVDELLDGIAAR